MSMRGDGKYLKSFKKQAVKILTSIVFGIDIIVGSYFSRKKKSLTFNSDEI